MYKATSHDDDDVDKKPRWRLVIVSMVHLNRYQWFDKFGCKQRSTSKECNEKNGSENGGRVPDDQCNSNRGGSEPNLAKFLESACAGRAILGMRVVDIEGNVLVDGQVVGVPFERNAPL